MKIYVICTIVIDLISFIFTDKFEEEVNSSKCSAENVVDSDFCPTDEKGKLDTKNTITKEVLCEETPKEVTVNCKNGCNKIVDNIPLTLDGKTHSDKQDKKEENEANVHSVNAANKSKNKSMSANVLRQHENEIQSHPKHVSKAKKENKNNSQSDLHAMDILDKTNSDATARQVYVNTSSLINRPSLSVIFSYFIYYIKARAFK